VAILLEIHPWQSDRPQLSQPAKPYDLKICADFVLPAQSGIASGIMFAVYFIFYKIVADLVWRFPASRFKRSKE
jgi:hypothetical protein